MTWHFSASQMKFFYKINKPYTINWKAPPQINSRSLKSNGLTRMLSKRGVLCCASFPPASRMDIFWKCTNSRIWALLLSLDKQMSMVGAGNPYVYMRQIFSRIWATSRAKSPSGYEPSDNLVLSSSPLICSPNGNWAVLENASDRKKKTKWGGSGEYEPYRRKDF